MSNLDIDLKNKNDKITIYPLFCGIELIVLDIEAPHYTPITHRPDNVLEINYCISGRSEHKMADGCLQYLGEGDIFLTTIHNHSERIELPLGHYQGIIIFIDLDKIKCGQICTDFKLPLDLSSMLNSFFTEDACFMVQAKNETLHLLANMHQIPDALKPAYFHIKTLELLLLLACIKPNEEKQVKSYSKEQVEIVKEIEKRISENLNERITIENLAKEYCISTSALKNYFKNIYGKSIAAYIKSQRMKQALMLLRDTNLSVSDIAKAVGYQSQSKFGAAFKGEMTYSPLEFRKRTRTDPKKY